MGMSTSFLFQLPIGVQSRWTTSIIALKPLFVLEWEIRDGRVLIQIPKLRRGRSSSSSCSHGLGNLWEPADEVVAQESLPVESSPNRARLTGPGDVHTSNVSLNVVALSDVADAIAPQVAAVTSSGGAGSVLYFHKSLRWRHRVTTNESL